MKRTAEILVCLSILATTAFAIFAPVFLEVLAMLGLFVVCVVVAIRQGIMRAVILFVKEMW